MGSLIVTSSIFNCSAISTWSLRIKDSVIKLEGSYFGLALGLFILDTLLIRLFILLGSISWSVRFIKWRLPHYFLNSWVIQKKSDLQKGAAPHQRNSLKYLCLGLLLTAVLVLCSSRNLCLIRCHQTVSYDYKPPRKHGQAAPSAAAELYHIQMTQYPGKLTEKTVGIPRFTFCRYHSQLIWLPQNNLCTKYGTNVTARSLCHSCQLNRQCHS